MAFATRDPFHDMEALRREIDRALETNGNNRWDFPFSRFSFLPARAARAYPLINISEDADNLYIEALAPGLSPDSLNVTVVRNQLTITGEKNGMARDVKPDAYHRNERATGRFARTVTLPLPVEDSNVKAEYRNGLLSLTLPKAEAAKPKQIKVKID